MRSNYLLVAGAGIVLLSACGGQGGSAINADLQKDLELASSADGISLGNGAVTAAQQFVTSIERTSPPARAFAPSARVKRHKPAPKSPPQVVQTEAPADAIDSEIQSVATAPVAENSDAPISPRPQPIAVSYPSGGSSVIRGGVVGDTDACERHRTRGTVISINNRIPFPIGGSGLGRVMAGRSVGRVAVGRNPVRSGGNVGSRFPH